ncbi:endogenous retrovirus group K member 8 Gag polyprotein-like [Macaca nemestrina]|uniref:endogenous retrovirus group K member 8 Gag polyprotein-like n=1 Tax=Macaca nemestrina TaxID=9545 RepID=UPI0039B8A2B8
MGQTKSKYASYRSFIKILLKRGGVKVSTKNLITLFQTIEQFCPWFPEQGTLDLKDWEKIGKELKQASREGKIIPLTVWNDWVIIKVALEPFQTEEDSVPISDVPKSCAVDCEKEAGIESRKGKESSHCECVSEPAMARSTQNVDNNQLQEVVYPETLKLEKKNPELAEPSESKPRWPTALPAAQMPATLQPQMQVKQVQTPKEDQIEKDRVSVMAMPFQMQCPQYQPVEDKTQPPVAYQYWPPAELQYQQPPENPYGQPGTFPVPQGRVPYPQPPTMKLNPTAPPSTQGSALHKIIDEARKQGDIEAWQFPVILEARPPGEGAQEGELPVAEARYKSFSIKMLKEMKEGVKQYGPNSPYMRTLLDSIAHGHRLIPYDWEILAKSSLSPSQFLQFKTWWIDGAQVQVRKNRTANPPIDIDADQLLGIGQNWSTVDQQVIMPNEAIEQIRAICLRAWEKIQDPGTACPSFNTIRQGSKEPYPDFVARLQDAAQKSITDENARKAIVERTNRTLKTQLVKQKKGGDSKECTTPQMQLNLALYTLNFLNIYRNQTTTSAEQHLTGKKNSPHEGKVIWWKDNKNKTWEIGKVITWGRGFACVSPGENQLPVWIPTKHLKFYNEPIGDAKKSASTETETPQSSTIDSHDEPSDDIKRTDEVTTHREGGAADLGTVKEADIVSWKKPS